MDKMPAPNEKEIAKPLIFCTRSVLAWQQNAKTQIRRLVKPLPDGHDWTPWQDGLDNWHWSCGYDEAGPHLSPMRQPYTVGDLVWIREALMRKDDGTLYEADNELLYSQASWEAWHGYVRWRWKRSKLPAMFCPRWACRYYARLTSVRAERLQDMGETDAVAEGTLVGLSWPGGTMGVPITARALYSDWWDQLHRKPGTIWRDNPWIWRYELEAADASTE